MPGINPPKYSKSEVSQRFNLKELLGYEPTEQQKKLFYEMVVDKMVQRTAGGKDINGSRFTPYSEKYAEKKGVSITSVDLILNGDMLSSFEESQVQKNVVKVKMAEGTETLKSYNHNVGDTLPKRTFFGVRSEEDIASIIRKVHRAKDQTREENRMTLADIRDAIQSTISIETEDLDGEG